MSPSPEVPASKTAPKSGSALLPWRFLARHSHILGYFTTAEPAAIIPLAPVSKAHKWSVPRKRCRAGGCVNACPRARSCARRRGSRSAHARSRAQRWDNKSAHARSCAQRWDNKSARCGVCPQRRGRLPSEIEINGLLLMRKKQCLGLAGHRLGCQSKRQAGRQAGR